MSDHHQHHHHNPLGQTAAVAAAAGSGTTTTTGSHSSFGSNSVASSSYGAGSGSNIINAIHSNTSSSASLTAATTTRNRGVSLTHRPPPSHGAAISTQQRGRHNSITMAGSQSNIFSASGSDYAGSLTGSQANAFYSQHSISSASSASAASPPAPPILTRGAVGIMAPAAVVLGDGEHDHRPMLSPSSAKDYLGESLIQEMGTSSPAIAPHILQRTFSDALESSNDDNSNSNLENNNNNSMENSPDKERDEQHKQVQQQKAPANIVPPPLPLESKLEEQQQQQQTIKYDNNDNKKITDKVTSLTFVETDILMQNAHATSNINSATTTISPTTVKKRRQSASSQKGAGGGGGRRRVSVAANSLKKGGGDYLTSPETSSIQQQRASSMSASSMNNSQQQQQQQTGTGAAATSGRQRRRFSASQDQQYRSSNIIETISVNELDKMKKLFDAHDADRSGSIDADELMPLLEELGHPMTKNQATDLLSQVDVNGNGLLEFSEFLQLVLIFKNVAQFRLYDTGGADEDNDFVDQGTKSPLRRRKSSAAGAGESDDLFSRCFAWLSSFFPFNHESGYLWAWEVILLAVCVYVWCSVTSVYAYGDVTRVAEQMKSIFDISDIVVSVLIGLEMFRQCVSRHRITVNGQAHMLTKLADISWRYVTSATFWCDLLSLLPLRTILQNSSSSSSSSNDVAGIVLAHFRLLFLWHVQHIMTRHSFADIDRWFVQFFLSFAPILSGAAGFLCVVHVCAISSFRIELTSTYAEAVYVVLYCFSGAGFGDVEPQTSQHRTFLSVLCLMSMIVNGFVIGSIVSFFGSSDVDSVRKSRLVQTLAVLDFFHVPVPLQEEILQFQNHLMAKNIQAAFASIVESLPSEMKVGLGLQVRIQLIRSVEIFRLAHPSTQIALAQELFTIILCPEEFVSLAEEEGEDMFFISYGFVDVLTAGGVYMQTLKMYESFGAEVVLHPIEDAVRHHHRNKLDDDAPLEIRTWGKYSFSAKTLTYVELLGLNIPTFDLILRQFPRFRKTIADVLLSGRSGIKTAKKLFGIQSFSTSSNSTSESTTTAAASGEEEMKKITSNVSSVVGVVPNREKTGEEEKMMKKLSDSVHHPDFGTHHHEVEYGEETPEVPSLIMNAKDISQKDSSSIKKTQQQDSNEEQQQEQQRKNKNIDEVGEGEKTEEEEEEEMLSPTLQESIVKNKLVARSHHHRGAGTRAPAAVLKKLQELQCGNIFNEGSPDEGEEEEEEEMFEEEEEEEENYDDDDYDENNYHDQENNNIIDVAISREQRQEWISELDRIETQVKKALEAAVLSIPYASSASLQSMGIYDNSVTSRPEEDIVTVTNIDDGGENNNNNNNNNNNIRVENNNNNNNNDDDVNLNDGSFHHAEVTLRVTDGDNNNNNNNNSNKNESEDQVSTSSTSVNAPVAVAAVVQQTNLSSLFAATSVGNNNKSESNNNSNRRGLSQQELSQHDAKTSATKTSQQDRASSNLSGERVSDLSRNTEVASASGARNEENNDNNNNNNEIPQNNNNDNAVENENNNNDEDDTHSRYTIDDTTMTEDESELTTTANSTSPKRKTSRRGKRATASSSATHHHHHHHHLSPCENDDENNDSSTATATSRRVSSSRRRHRSNRSRGNDDATGNINENDDQFLSPTQHQGETNTDLLSSTSSRPGTSSNVAVAIANATSSVPEDQEPDVVAIVEVDEDEL